jgi:hypothetical protein
MGVGLLSGGKTRPGIGREADATSIFSDPCFLSKLILL